MYIYVWNICINVYVDTHVHAYTSVFRVHADPRGSLTPPVAEALASSFDPFGFLSCQELTAKKAELIEHIKQLEKQLLQCPGIEIAII